MKNSCFSRLTPEEKTEKLVRTIRAKTGDMLTNDELTTLRNVDINKQYEIQVVNMPREFNNLLTLKRFHDGNQKTIENGVKLFGSYEFGKNEATYVKEQFAGGTTIKAYLSDTTKPAAAVIHTSNIGYDDLSIPYKEDKIVVYIPYSEEAKQIAG